MCNCLHIHARFWHCFLPASGHNTRHWACFSEEDSIGVLKDVAKHVSGNQCEKYMMKVARLRPATCINMWIYVVDVPP